MILSGHYVLFIDPSKEYLGRGQSCFGIVSLEHMKRYVKHISKCTPCLMCMVSGFSLHTFPSCMVIMVMIVQWMNIMGYDLTTLLFSG